MRLSIVALAAAALVGQAGLSMADDTNSDRPVESHKQMMRDCLQQERQANPQESKQDMRRVCRDKLKTYNNHPSETAPPSQMPPSEPPPQSSPQQ
jgi:uncharacterized membrane protein YccC